MFIHVFFNSAHFLTLVLNFISLHKKAKTHVLWIVLFLNIYNTPSGIHLVCRFFHAGLFFLRWTFVGIGGGYGSRGFGMVPKPGSSGRIRACVEVVLVQELMKNMEEKLREENLYLPFRDVSDADVIRSRFLFFG